MQITDTQVRFWLEELRKGRTPYDPEFVSIMRSHGYDPGDKTRAEMARDAAEFLRHRIESLRAPRGASPNEQMPHAVLTLCWVEGWKSTHAAKRLGMSERQMSRERSRAVRLLRDALTGFPEDAPTVHEPLTWAELVAQLQRIETAVGQIANAAASVTADASS